MANATKQRPVQKKKTKKQQEKEVIDQLCDSYFALKEAHSRYERAKRNIKKLTGYKRTLTENYIIEFTEEDRGIFQVDARDCKVMMIKKRNKRLR
jgi:hypothetical protein